MAQRIEAKPEITAQSVRQIVAGRGDRAKDDNAFPCRNQPVEVSAHQTGQGSNAFGVRHVVGLIQRHGHKAVSRH